MGNVYLARQPILDNNSDLCAFEIVYRDVDNQSHNNEGRYASASVINNILNKFGTRSLLGHRRAFIKVDETFLLHDMIFTIPKEFFIFSILSSVVMNERVIERIEQLNAKGYCLAINDLLLNEDRMQKYESIFKEISFFKINLNAGKSLHLKEMISKLQSHDIKVVAAKIETRAEYTQARELGCDWFQGYFFAEPKIMKNVKYEPSQMNIIKLYNLLMQDTNIDEITAEFEKTPEITVQLLQFINSGTFHFRKRISSIHHILVLVGRKPLAQWLMLMIYSKSVAKGSVGHSPLMLMVQHRTELMQAILNEIKYDAGSNMLGEAYFVGILSLMDTVFSMELANILEHMNISDEVQYALLNDEGILGDIYVLVRDIEAFNIKNVAKFGEKYNLDIDAIQRIIMKCMENTTLFENPEAA